MSSPPIIDAWMQPPTRAFLNHPMFASIRRWIRADAQLEQVPPELVLMAMDGAGVQLALLSAWWGPEGAMIHNDEVARWVEAYPQRFQGVASVDLRDPMAGVRELRRCVQELGFKALRILPWLWELPPNHRRYYPLYAACVDLGIPFCLQVGHTGPLRGSEYGRPIPFLDDVALDFPELTLVAGHIGYPWTTEMIALATKYPQVYIDTSAYKASRYPRELVDFMRGHGRKKVLFGSNAPMLLPGDCLEALPTLGLDEDAERLFLAGNARRVFKLDL